MPRFLYGLAYLSPALFLLSIHSDGIAAFSVVIFNFILIPLLEPFLPNSAKNLPETRAATIKNEPIFDWFLYLNIPLVFACLLLFVQTAQAGSWQATEWLGFSLSLGVIFGVNGINVAHELGHRTKKRDRFFAIVLLTPSFYQHFYIEHNRGHHKNVSTPEDPVSARLNEPIYTFWFRAVIMSYIGAWRLEAARLSKAKKRVFSLENQMVQFTLLQASCLDLLFWLLPMAIALALLGASVVGFLLLETVDYIEHYGLVRQKKENGKFERTQPRHSWNSNRLLGRVVLFELTRHSDHHYLASKKYQILDHHDEAPELPMGYPAAMLLSLLPPVWFSVMNKRIDSSQKFA